MRSRLVDDSKLEAGMELAGRYRLVGPLGEGASGWVWSAEDRTLRRSVALKLMKPEATPGSAGRRRFLREARVISAISHPNVIAIHDVLELDGSPVLIMERLSGE